MLLAFAAAGLVLCVPQQLMQEAVVRVYAVLFAEIFTD